MDYDIGLIIGSIFILALYSLPLYKDTLVYSIAEHMLVGVTAGYMVIISLKAIGTNAITPLINGKTILLIPIILGFLIYTQFLTKIRIISRYPMAIIVGMGAAFSVRRMLLEYLVQYFVSISALKFTGVDMFTIFNNIIIIIAIISSLSYFIMSREQVGSYGKFTKIGRLFMMVVFGLYFGGQVMTRVVIISGRFEYILKAFHLIP